MEINVEKHLEKLYYGQTLEKAKEEFKDFWKMYK